MANIYAKLQDCKAALQACKLPKTGKNAFAKYDYWELSDFLPTVVSLFKKNGLCSYFSFTNEFATLTVVNTEKSDETITITSPMAAAELKGCHAIQNMGAVETYQRRYLYMALLDISEPDALDATQGNLENAHNAKVKAAEQLANKLLKPEELSTLLDKYKVSQISELSDGKLDGMIKWLRGKK
jgi:hypothetical protein